METVTPSTPAGVKTCSGSCGLDLPATVDYFDRDESKPDGMRQICKSCRAETRMVSERKQVDERIRKIDDASLKLLDQIAKSGSNVPHCAELYQRIVEVFEGAGGFAMHFMAQYLSCRPGSAQRTKMLETVLRLSMKVSDSGAAQVPVELMNDEDLQFTLDQQAKRIYRITSDDNGEVKEAS